MTDDKPVSIPALITAMKEAGFATRADVEDIVHTQLTNYHAGMVAPEFEKIAKDIHGIRVDIVELKDTMQVVKNDVKWIKDDVENKS